MKDGSDNGRDLTEVVNAEFVNSDASKAVQLNGGESYVGTPMEKLGYPAQITFDVKLDEVVPGQILFEEDSAYGTHDIRLEFGAKPTASLTAFKFSRLPFSLPFAHVFSASTGSAS